MSIGETLAQARRQAGLTVPQLSQQTRIRETIIRGIEQDDYSGCGGDFYARGHIRAMARAIGADPVPLIQEYDETTGALNGLGPGGEGYGGEDYGNVRVSPSPGAPGQAGHAPSVFDPAPPPPQASPAFQASPPPSAPRAPSVFAPTHRPPPSQPDSAYPASSVFDAVDQASGNPEADAYRLPDEPSDETYQFPYETSDDTYQLPPDTGNDTYQLPHETSDNTYQLPPEASDDTYQLPPEASDDTYQVPHYTGDDTYQLPHETSDNTYQLPPEASDDTYQVPHYTGDDTYQLPHETSDNTYQLPPETSDDTYQLHREADDNRYWLSPEAGDDAGPGLAPPPMTREPWAVPPPVSREPRPPQAPPVRRRPPPRPPARDRERGASWLSSMFDSAPEDPSEITEPNGVRPAITGSKPPPRRENRLAIFAVAALVVIGLLAYLLVNVFSSSPPAKLSAGATASQGTHPKTGGASGHPSATPSQTPSSAPPAPVALRPAGVEAFGPSGTGQGDNPQEAAQAIDHSSSTGWATDWYSTSQFGNLQSGTGLLLKMGRTVTISSAEIMLASTPGADVQLRVGSSPSLTALKPVAHANNAGGVVRLRVPKAVSARYVLVWFTGLPRDSAGTYQAKVYNITLKGNS